MIGNIQELTLDEIARNASFGVRTRREEGAYVAWRTGRMGEARLREIQKFLLEQGIKATWSTWYKEVRHAVRVHNRKDVLKLARLAGRNDIVEAYKGMDFCDV